MHLIQHECYHIYNRGNNRKRIFFSPDNYLFFLGKIRKLLMPCADILAWCLMPNHFHLMIHANEASIAERKSHGGIPMQEFSYRLGILQSSYTQAINKTQRQSGSLFQQKASCKLLHNFSSSQQDDSIENCFHYIHANPSESSIVNDPAEWPYSSLQDYLGIRAGNLCNKELLKSISGLDDNLIRIWRALQISQYSER